MNYYKKLAVHRVLGVSLGEMFILSDMDSECVYRIVERGLEMRIGTCWYKSYIIDGILSGKYGEIISIG